jgi:peptidoglycan/xylan/chitin deacetylase (PgdA/CDA1 family)
VSDGLAEIGLADAGPVAGLRWAEGGRFLVPADVADALGDRFGAPGELRLTEAPVSGLPDGAAQDLRLRNAYTLARPASSRLPISYQHAPEFLRTLVARGIGVVQRRRSHVWAEFPRWPLDLSSDFLADLSASRAAEHQGPVPVMLSHDLDSAEGLRNLVQRFLGPEEAAGARSASYVVPCKYSLDTGLLDEVRDRGHEIGIHGYDHGNRTPFAPAEERRRRLEAASALIERYGVRGYRAPSLLRTPGLLADLAGLYDYDSSIPTSGGLFPVPNTGCASARPFRLGGLLEIPLTMPRDGSLRFLGYGPDAILDLWKACAGRIATAGGVVMLLTHCEDRFTGGRPMLRAYEAFLQWLAMDGRFAFCRPAELLAREPSVPV